MFLKYLILATLVFMVSCSTSVKMKPEMMKDYSRKIEKIAIQYHYPKFKEKIGLYRETHPIIYFKNDIEAITVPALISDGINAIEYKYDENSLEDSDVQSFAKENEASHILHYAVEKVTMRNHRIISAKFNLVIIDVNDEKVVWKTKTDISFPMGIAPTKKDFNKDLKLFNDKLISNLKENGF